MRNPLHDILRAFIPALSTSTAAVPIPPSDNGGADETSSADGLPGERDVRSDRMDAALRLLETADLAVRKQELVRRGARRTAEENVELAHGYGVFPARNEWRPAIGLVVRMAYGKLTPEEGRLLDCYRAENRDRGGH